MQVCATPASQLIASGVRSLGRSPHAWSPQCPCAVVTRRPLDRRSMLDVRSRPQAHARSSAWGSPSLDRCPFSAPACSTARVAEMRRVVSLVRQLDGASANGCNVRCWSQGFLTDESQGEGRQGWTSTMRSVNVPVGVRAGEGGLPRRPQPGPRIDRAFRSKPTEKHACPCFGLEPEADPCRMVTALGPPEIYARQGRPEGFHHRRGLEVRRVRARARSRRVDHPCR